MAGLAWWLPIVLLLTSCTDTTNGTSPPPLPAKTEVIVFEPFTVTGTLDRDIIVDSTHQGMCWTESNYLTRPDAYRCMFGNFIVDPCLSDTTGLKPVVACEVPNAKGANDVLLLHLTKPLPKRYGSGAPSSAKSPPFMLVLSDDTRCVPHGGTASIIAGSPQTYDCNDDSSIVGDIDRSSPGWTARATVPGSSELATVTIAKVYV